MLYTFRYRHIFPAPKSCTPRALPRASPKGRTNDVTTEGSAPCTTSIIENENRSLLSNLKDGNPILHRPKVSLSFAEESE